MDKRLARKRLTVNLMIDIHCRGRHRARELCAECVQLIDYVEHRLASCPFQAQKPTCLLCQVHCYAPAMRAQIRKVMRYSGPRMLVLHPLLTIRHWLDGMAIAPSDVRKKHSDRWSPPR